MFPVVTEAEGGGALKWKEYSSFKLLKLDAHTGKPENKFAFEEKFLDRQFTLGIMHETHR